MKQYVIDQLRPEDHERLRTYLDEHLKISSLEGIYWLPLDASVLTETQKRHDACGPHYAALELTSDRLSCELLIRAENRLRCDCVGYAITGQRDWLLAMVDAILQKLDIRI
jgi:hypothetical protein